MLAANRDQTAGVKVTLVFAEFFAMSSHLFSY